MFQNVPNELKSFRSWVVWKIEITDTGRPTKVPYNPQTFLPASSTDPTTWVSFDEAVTAHTKGGWDGIGFVLSDADPFTFVDLDDPYAKNPDGTAKHQNPEKIAEVQGTIARAFSGTYAEISPSGTGLHIIALGISPSGRRRNAVEMYSSARFMTMTGNVYQAAPVVDKQASIKWLYDEMGGAPVINTFTGEYVDAETDEQVIAKCMNAANGDKVRDLVNGNWQHHYPSQSEADFALIDIIAYYTKSRFQILRLFRMSALGQREKANRDKYILGMIDRAFDRMPAPLDVDAVVNSINNHFAREQEKGRGTAEAMAVASRPSPAPVEAPKPVSGDYTPDNPYLRPVPGLLGEIAYYIYDQAPRPVAEIALAGAIGLMAGIIGRAYNISGTGLNQYTLLLTGTGRGKEAIQSGISKLMSRVTAIDGGGGIPSAGLFVGPSELPSGQGLHKHLGKTSNSFVSIIGEVDNLLKNMTARNANAGLVRLKQILLQLYSVSGEGNQLGGTAYSDQDKNVAAIVSPAFSMIGEGTPGNFYQLLDDSMVASGLLPRFTVIEYSGYRVPMNEARANIQPPDWLVRKLATLCGHCLRLNQQNRPVHVQLAPAAQAMLSQFDKTCDGIINAAHNETIEQLWNRAHLKALKLAATVAVGVDYVNPVIQVEHAEYAIACVRHDISRLVAKFQTGDVGDGMSKQMSDMRKAVRQMLNINEARAKKLGMTWEMVRDRLISRRGLQQSTTGIASFKNSREGSGRAFDTVIKELHESGIITTLGTADLNSKYGKQVGRYYVLMEPNWLDTGE